MILSRLLTLILLLSFSLTEAQLRSDPINPIPTVPWATTAPALIRTWQLYEDASTRGRMGIKFIYSGGLHATSASLTTVAFATEAFVPERVAQTSVAITYSTASANDVCWTIISSDQDGIAGWTRVGSTSYYFRCQNNTTPLQPTLPPNSAWLSEEIILASAISQVLDLRVPYSFIRNGIYDITDPLYGAVPDESTDNALAIETALMSAPDGIVVYIPPTALCFGVKRNVFVYRSNRTLQGGGLGSCIKAISTFVLTGNAGMIEFGTNPATGAVAISNLIIRDITLDGNHFAKALAMQSVTRGLVTNTRLLNGGPNGPSLFTYLTTDLEIHNNRVEGAIGTFGDGIYVANGTHTRITDNVVYNFTRLGIVTEGDSSVVYTSDVYIAGNYISHGRNSTNPEHNAGIWMEHTCGARVIGNHIEDMTNTPGTAYTAGIVISNNSPGGCHWTIQSNWVSGAHRGLQIQPEVTDEVTVNSFHVSRGTLTDYTIGINIASGAHILIDQLLLGANNFTIGKWGVLVDTTAGAAIQSLTIQNSAVDTTASYTNATATFFIFAIGAGGIESVNLQGLHDWRVLMNDPPAHLSITNSQLTADSTYIAFQASNTLRLTNSLITQVNPTVAGTVFKAINGAKYLFSNSIFEGLVNTYDNGAGGLNMFISYSNCHFTAGTSLVFAGAFDVLFEGNTFVDNAAAGAIRANGRNLTMTLTVRHNNFRHTNVALTPVIVTSFSPTTTVLVGNRYDTTLLTTILTAQEVGQQGVLQANLLLRANGSLVYCSDCTIANPCAGGGTGALAKRLNGAWVCN